MRNKVLITLLILSLILIPGVSLLAQELDRESIAIKISIAEIINVEFGKQGLSTFSAGDSQTLDLNLAEGTGSSTKLRVSSNNPLSVSFESINGFGEDINGLFEYVVEYDQEGEEKKVTFTPGGNIPEGIIVMEPGHNEFKLTIRLKDNIAEQWEILLDEETELEPDALGTEWTQLDPGVYNDLVNLTFHHLPN